MVCVWARAGNGDASKQRTGVRLVRITTEVSWSAGWRIFRCDCNNFHCRRSEDETQPNTHTKTHPPPSATPTPSSSSSSYGVPLRQAQHLQHEDKAPHRALAVLSHWLITEKNNNRNNNNRLAVPKMAKLFVRFASFAFSTLYTMLVRWARTDVTERWRWMPERETAAGAGAERRSLFIPRLLNGVAVQM